MAEPIASPDVPLWLCTWLRAALTARPETICTGVFVSDEMPNPRRTKMVIVRRDGGRRRSLVLEDLSLGVNVWAATKTDTATLSFIVQGLIASTQALGPMVTVIPASGPTIVPDESEHHRRYLTFDVTARCKTI